MRVQKPETWPLLTTLVQIVPDDILPVRAKYSGEPQATIGINYLSDSLPPWFTLADCLASKLLIGRPPKILKAVRFTPGGPQDDLKLVSIGGSEVHIFDPVTDDFYRRLIDLRSQVKKQLKTARELRALGHEVRLMPPQYVKAYLKRTGLYELRRHQTDIVPKRGDSGTRRFREGLAVKRRPGYHKATTRRDLSAFRTRKAIRATV